MLLACGANTNYIKNKISDLDLRQLKDDSYGFIRDLFRFFTEYGYCKGDKLLHMCENMVNELTGSSKYTFKQLYDKNKIILIITGSNLDTGKTVLFSHTSYENMPITLAVRISCSYPLIFRTVKFNGDLYTDGGLYFNYPINVFDEIIDDEYIINEKTLGLKLITSENNNNNKIGKGNPKKYVESLIYSLHTNIQKLHIKKDDWKRTIKINIDPTCSSWTSLNFNITNEDKKWLISQGKLSVKQFLDNIGIPDSDILYNNKIIIDIYL